MIRFIIPLMTILFLVPPIMAGAAMPGYSVVAQSEEDDITLYGKEMNGLYFDFKVDFKGDVFSRPFWINVTNPAYPPQLYYQDIIKDKRNELIIILTRGYGTGVLDQEVYVFHPGNKRFKEVLVDSPLAIVNKNIRTSLTPSKAEISIGNKHFSFNVKELKLLPETLFEEISLGSIINYEVKDDKLTATLHPQLSPGAFVGNIIITYEFQDNMYQAEKIEFKLENE
ncbi:hypothetical protein [Bacillus sp. P14.5]|uniref:hypothetical protein n=1 Tax=Bacillus sp. P14.5 TaxID=1983400 RepID=UPI001F05CE41|nr:hypothetical protein [Bacillus sp. P14.5]